MHGKQLGWLYSRQSFPLSFHGWEFSTNISSRRFCYWKETEGVAPIIFCMGMTNQFFFFFKKKHTETSAASTKRNRKSLKMRWVLWSDGDSKTSPRPPKCIPRVHLLKLIPLYGVPDLLRAQSFIYPTMINWGWHLGNGGRPLLANWRDKVI